MYAEWLALRSVCFLTSFLAMFTSDVLTSTYLGLEMGSFTKNTSNFSTSQLSLFPAKNLSQSVVIFFGILYPKMTDSDLRKSIRLIPRSWPLPNPKQILEWNRAVSFLSFFTFNLSGSLPLLSVSEKMKDSSECFQLLESEPSVHGTEE